MLNYYVSTSGSDDNSGISKSSAFATILKASMMVKPGDNVNVFGGTYEVNSPMNISCIGTEENPITFKAYSEKTPIFDFSKVTDIHPKEFVINITPGTRHVIFDGLEFCNSPASGIIMINCFGITIKNCKVHDIAQFGISVRSDNCLIENNEVYLIAKAWKDCFDIGSHPQILNTYFKPPIAPAVVGSYAYNNVFRGNYIHECWGEGIDPIFGDGILVEDNIIKDVLSVGVYLDSTMNIIIRNNYIVCTDETRSRKERGRRMSGIGMGCEYFGCWSDNAPIAHNENIQIYNNVISGVGSGFMQWYDFVNTDYKNTYEKVKIFNNTVDTFGIRGEIFEVATNLPVTPVGNECKNNIFKGITSIGMDDVSIAFENNLWVNGIPKEGVHKNSFVGEAGFINGEMGGAVEGYKLNEESLCIGKGENITGICKDIEKNERHNPPCLGAYEAGANLSENQKDARSYVEEVIPQHIPGFPIGINVLANGSFEEDGKETKVAPKGWESIGELNASFVAEDSFKGIYDDLHYRFIVGNGPLRDPMNPISDGKFCMKQSLDTPFHVYTYQVASNVTNGRYGLHARVKRIGNDGIFYMEVKDFGGQAIRCNIPVVASLNTNHVDCDKKWFQLNVSDIIITNGQCTIGFNAEGGPEDFVHIDEVWLYRY
ncbi:right-handed parallel beta-helix repeat-containing protein [Clostridium lacusfryxellense]|uniref:right-handed parallel beta-helix repeat-containing protein n=1 Tax=Clostridium lacusfryxellense TaxID=205328 RepID=UPI001C0B949A|nr:right-handed parallel beta-helix repeat-containing protein [Clostridium lacusfryxellense]MBU3113330.1 right-handed parallel beta-helix repeat-containing protein [Clostridium lacusfryxellense]